MKEAQAIVSNPQGYFRLGEEDAELLSRFLIEDSKNEHVYCDPNN